MFQGAGPLEVSVHRELSDTERHGEWFLAPPSHVIRCVAGQLLSLEQ